jgi:hypothetical protein
MAKLAIRDENDEEPVAALRERLVETRNKLI